MFNILTDLIEASDITLTLFSALGSTTWLSMAGSRMFFHLKEVAECEEQEALDKTYGSVVFEGHKTWGDSMQ